MPCHVTSCHVTSRHTSSHHITSRYVARDIRTGDIRTALALTATLLRGVWLLHGVRSNDYRTRFWCRARPGDPLKTFFVPRAFGDEDEHNPDMAGPSGPAAAAAAMSRPDMRTSMGPRPGGECTVPSTLPPPPRPQIGVVVLQCCDALSSFIAVLCSVTFWRLLLRSVAAWTVLSLLRIA
jgi:hypothetical protein